MIKNFKTIFALSMCAVLTIGLSTIASCSADEDYSAFAGDELETLAEGDMNVGIEGIPPGGATQQVDLSIQSDQIENYYGVWSVAFLNGYWNNNKWVDVKEYAENFLGWNGTKGLNQNQIQILSAHFNGPSRRIIGRIGNVQDSILTMENTWATGAIDSMANVLISNLSGKKGVYKLNKNILLIKNLNHCMVAYKIDINNSAFYTYDLVASDLSLSAQSAVYFSEVSDLIVY